MRFCFGQMDLSVNVRDLFVVDIFVTLYFFSAFAGPLRAVHYALYFCASAGLNRPRRAKITKMAL